jgi:hypothetical protein
MDCFTYPLSRHEDVFFIHETFVVQNPRSRFKGGSKLPLRISLGSTKVTLLPMLCIIPYILSTHLRS